MSLPKFTQTWLHLLNSTSSRSLLPQPTNPLSFSTLPQPNILPQPNTFSSVPLPQPSNLSQPNNLSLPLPQPITLPQLSQPNNLSQDLPPTSLPQPISVSQPGFSTGPESPCCVQPLATGSDHTPQVNAHLPSSQQQVSVSTHPMTTQLRDNTRTKKKFPDHVSFVATKHPLPTSTDLEPTSFTLANKFPEWRDAMASELNALAHNNTWILVPSSPDQHVIGCKWIYKVKRNADGTIQRHKARLVAKGYTQEEGIDYHETFSPVVKPTTIRLVLSLAVSHHWTIQQLDVNNAFLYGDLQKQVYMAQPPGFVDPLHPSHVCLLKKAPMVSNRLHVHGFTS